MFRLMLINSAINLLFQQISGDMIRVGIEAMIDKLEDMAAGTETTLDDRALTLLRDALKLPDEPDA